MLTWWRFSVVFHIFFSFFFSNQTPLCGESLKWLRPSTRWKLRYFGKQHMSGFFFATHIWILGLGFWWFLKLHLWYIYIIMFIKLTFSHVPETHLFLSMKNGRCPLDGTMWQLGGGFKVLFNYFLFSPRSKLETIQFDEHTPWKINMEPTNHPFRRETDLPIPPWLCSMLIFRGVCFKWVVSATN